MLFVNKVESINLCKLSNCNLAIKQDKIIEMILQIYLSCSNFLFDQVLDKCHSEKFNMVFITLPCFGTYTQFAIWPAQSKVGHILFVLSRKLMMPFSIRLKVIMGYL